MRAPVVASYSWDAAIRYWTAYYVRHGEVGAPLHCRYISLQNPEHTEILYAVFYLEDESFEFYIPKKIVVTNYSVDKRCGEIGEHRRD